MCVCVCMYVCVLVIAARRIAHLAKEATSLHIAL